MSSLIGLTVGQPFNPYKLFVGIFIPEALVVNPEVSPGAKLIFGQLARYAGSDGDCHPAVKTLGEKVGLKERQTQYHIRELETLGFLTTVKRFKAPNVPDTNGYEFLWHESFNGSVRAPGVVHSTAPGVVHSTAPGVVHSTAPGVVHSTAPGVVHSTAPKESPSEESQLKESVPPSADLAVANASSKAKPGNVISIDDPPFAAPQEPGCILEPPKAPLSADQRTINATARHLYDNHQVNRRGSLERTEAVLRDIAKLERQRPIPVLMEFIRLQHAKWRASKDWREKFANALSGSWLERDMWKQPPPTDTRNNVAPSTPRDPMSKYRELLADGTLAPRPTGTIGYPEFLGDGSIRYPDGRIKYPDGRVTIPSSAVG